MAKGPLAPWSEHQPVSGFSSVSQRASHPPPYSDVTLSTSAPLANAVRLISGADADNCAAGADADSCAAGADAEQPRRGRLKSRGGNDREGEQD